MSSRDAIGTDKICRGDSYSGELPLPDQKRPRSHRAMTSTMICREMLVLLGKDRPQPSGGELEESMISTWVEKEDLEISPNSFSKKVLVPLVEKINQHLKRQGGTGALGQGTFLLLPEMDNAIERYREISLRTILYSGMGTNNPGGLFLRFDFSYEKGSEIGWSGKEQEKIKGQG